MRLLRLPRALPPPRLLLSLNSPPNPLLPSPSPINQINLITDAALDYAVTQSYDHMYGARPLRRWLEHSIVTPLSRMIISGGCWVPLGAGCWVLGVVGAGGWCWVLVGQQPPAGQQGTELGVLAVACDSPYVSPIRIPTHLPILPAGELPDDSKVVVDAPEGAGLTFFVQPDEEAAAARAAENQVRAGR